MNNYKHTLEISSSINSKPKNGYPILPIFCDWFIIFCCISFTVILEIAVDAHSQCIPHDGSADCMYESSKLAERASELSYPHKDDTIPGYLLLVLIIIPWLLALIVNVIILKIYDDAFKMKIVFRNLEILVRMAFFAGFGTEAVVSAIKLGVGRPRPNYYALEDSNNESDNGQSHKSFPSGHAAMSMAMLFVLTLNLFESMMYAQNRFRKVLETNMNDNDSDYGVRTSMNSRHSYFFGGLWWKLRYYLLFDVIIVLSPTFLALYIGCTRITDYWHHYADVAVGSLLGCAGAIISFYVYKSEFDCKNISEYNKLIDETDGGGGDDDDDNNNINDIENDNVNVDQGLMDKIEDTD